MTSDFNLSRAAEDALDEVTAGIKQEVAWRAGTIAGGQRAAAGVRDVVEALAELTDREDYLRRRLRNARMITLGYTAIGLVGMITYVLVKPGAVSAGGLPVGLLSGILIGSSLAPVVLMAADRRVRHTSYVDRIASVGVLRAWIQMEASIRARYSHDFGESRGTAPLGDMLNDLLRERVISEEDSEEIRQLLRRRNAIAHGKPTALSAQEAKRLLEKTEKINQKVLAFGSPSSP